MFRKLSNKTLLIIFVVLALLAMVVFLTDYKKGERTFKSELFTVDSATVTAITIYPKGHGKEPMKLSKSGTGWEILSQNKRFPADTSAIKNMLHTLVHVVPERVSGTDRTSWKEFEISDSLSSRIVVEQGNNITADFRVGKLSFSQREGRNMQRYGGNQNMEVKSHVRISGDDRVYVVDGFLSMMFGGNPTQYRNRMVLKLDKNLVTKLTFVYPGDSSFVLNKKGNKWYVNELPADSAQAEKYISSITYTSGNEFADDANLFPNYRYSLKVEGNNMSPIEVSGAYDEGSKKYFVKSAMNPSSTFGSSTPALFYQLFTSRKKFSWK